LTNSASSQFPGAGGRVAQSGGTLHSYIAQQYGVKRNREMLEDTDVRASILRHAKDVCILFTFFY
jgi:hypothetical protein